MEGVKHLKSVISVNLRKSIVDGGKPLKGHISTAEIVNSCNITTKIYRGYSNVFVKYVFDFSSEVDNIYIS